VKRTQPRGAPLTGSTAVTGDILADLMYTPAYRRRHPGPYDTLGIRRCPARRRHLVASNEPDAWDGLPDIIRRQLIQHGTDDQHAPLSERRSAGGAHFAPTRHTFYGARHAYFEECREEAGPGSGFSAGLSDQRGPAW